MSKRRVRVDRRSRTAAPARSPRAQTRPAAQASAAPPPAAACKCPALDPADWHDVESDWGDIAFVRGATAALLGVPFRLSHARSGVEQRARSLGAKVAEDAMFLLGAGRLRRPVLLEVEGTGDRPGFERPGGWAYSQLHEAPFGAVARLLAQTKAAAATRYGRDPDSLWIWYVTCKECSAERNFETLFVAHYRA